MTKICSHCNVEKDVDDFGKRSSNKDGISNICKQCRREICLQSYYKHKDTVRKNAKLYKDRIQQYINEYKSGGCIICGESDLSCLDLHHLYNKKFNISRAINRYSLDAINEELNKCVVLCANCHRKLHANRITLPQGFDSMVGRLSKISKHGIKD